MVSLRRRKNLGLSLGTRSPCGKAPFQVELPRRSENCNTAISPTDDAKPLGITPLLSFSSTKSPGEDTKPLSSTPSTSFSPDYQMPVVQTEACSESSNISGFRKSKVQLNPPFQGKLIRNRRRRKRNHYKGQDHFQLRGVYYKNTKWRAAIKVDQKQIHLGTVESQEAAARLYDRAAFMRGRSTNFELPEEDKQELSQYNWEDFLALTRNGITTKEPNRKQKKPATPSESDYEEY